MRQKLYEKMEGKLTFLMASLVLIIALGLFTTIYFLDFDNDGLKNHQELLNSTNWLNSDTDDDNIPDLFEKQILKSNPTIPQRDIGKIISMLKKDDSLSEPEIIFLRNMINNPDFRAIANEVNTHRDGKITEVEINFISFLIGCPYTSTILEQNFQADGKITSHEFTRIKVLLEKALGHN